MDVNKQHRGDDSNSPAAQLQRKKWQGLCFGVIVNINKPTLIKIYGTFDL